MTIFFAQALAEYGAMSALADTFTRLSIRLSDAVGEWRVEAIVGVIVAALLWKAVTATR